jgi:hypothetical protein
MENSSYLLLSFAVDLKLMKTYTPLKKKSYPKLARWLTEGKGWASMNSSNRMENLEIW